MSLAPTEILEWTGCITGVVGSVMLAARHSHAAWAFVLYLISSCTWIAFGVLTGASGLITMQIVFVGTAILGIYNWLILPRQANRKSPSTQARID